MSAYTPGPWKYDGAGYGNIRPVKETGQNICTFARCFSQESYEQNKADARLMAAAPDLLEALKTALETPGMIRGRDKAVAAIAKAEKGDA